MIFSNKPHGQLTTLLSTEIKTYLMLSVINQTDLSLYFVHNLLLHLMCLIFFIETPLITNRGSIAIYMYRDDLQ